MTLVMLNVLALVNTAGNEESIVALIRPRFEGLARLKLPRQAHRQEVFDRRQRHESHPVPGGYSSPCDKREAHSRHGPDHAGALEGHDNTVRLRDALRLVDRERPCQLQWNANTDERAYPLGLLLYAGYWHPSGW